MFGDFSASNPPLFKQLAELQNQLDESNAEKLQLESQLNALKAQQLSLLRELKEQQLVTAEITQLRQQVDILAKNKKKLEISLDVITEHADLFEMQLVDAQNSLEQKVTERTQELEEKNNQLQAEIQERSRIETELLHAKESADVARISAEMANQAKSIFLAKMSHELRTPLNAILGYGELLQEDLTDMGLAEFSNELHQIQRAGEHLLSLVSDILDVSKIETETLALSLTEFTVNDMVNNVVSLIRPTLKGNILEVRCFNKVGTMRADATRVQQILQNLLSNAIKFTKQGRICFAVKLRADYVYFRVKDTGIGIPAEKLSSIFEAFNQVDNSYTRQYDGSGIGLTLCKQLCQAMNGEVYVKSILGQGSAFTVQLPRYPEND
ncbi:ATP-binding protein [Beggiatoa leptomitoformis]|uniref:histidine kinase n=1 Tax=Beggiatoa leptomitoformis TaxID=288004 RepID=A0A2N9YIC2_9GAMM|nr:ATP-binding protein [Beggiatoa leptomitoformis]AUI70244.1 hypothetical protein BLE401_17090 [Beggiatoa leptomitoformis]QGX03622.1 hypothetical protein AL038_07225 [Beggiatoa leptomitoformis]